MVYLLILNRRKIYVQYLPTGSVGISLWHHSLYLRAGRNHVGLPRPQPRFLSPRHLSCPLIYTHFYSELAPSLWWPIRPYSVIWSPAPWSPHLLLFFPLLIAVTTMASSFIPCQAWPHFSILELAVTSSLEYSSFIISSVTFSLSLVLLLIYHLTSEALLTHLIEIVMLS